MAILCTDESYHNMVSISTIVIISVSIEMLLFFIILIVHCCLAFEKVFPNFKLRQKRCASPKDELPLIGDTTEGSPARAISCREELIFDVYFNQKHK